MRKLVFFLFLLYFNSCKRDNGELSGHWISSEYFDGQEFKTIDFENEIETSLYSGKDTASYFINFNKNSLSNYGGYKSFLVKVKESYEFYTPHYESVMRLWFKNDTLFIRGTDYKFYDGDFIKMNKSESIYKELFNGTNISGWLPSRNNSDSILDEGRLKLSSNINIGKGKYDSIPSNSPSNSIRINVWDTYLSIKDLTQFVSRQQDALPETERQNLMIILNSDSSVSKEFLGKVINQVNKADSTLKIYQSTFDYQTNKVYYRKVKRDAQGLNNVK